MPSFSLSSHARIDSLQPTLISSLRGACFFDLSISSGGKCVDAGFFRGTIDEPLSDLVQLLDSLTNEKGEFAVDGCKSTIR